MSNNIWSPWVLNDDVPWIIIYCRKSVKILVGELIMVCGMLLCNDNLLLSLPSSRAAFIFAYTQQEHEKSTHTIHYFGFPKFPLNTDVSFGPYEGIRYTNSMHQRNYRCLVLKNRRHNCDRGCSVFVLWNSITGQWIFCILFTVDSQHLNIDEK